jgi:hypothetical protein
MVSVPKVYRGQWWSFAVSHNWETELWIKDMKMSRKGVQEGSAIESTKTRMERVLSELWRLVKIRRVEYKVTEDKKTS